MVELFKIGNFTIYIFGVMVAIGMIIGIYLNAQRSQTKGFRYVLSERRFKLNLEK